MEILEVGKNKLYRVDAGASAYLLCAKGARIMNWNLSMADGSVRDVIYAPDNMDLASADFPPLHGGMPVLFPFAGASFADGKEGFWKTPSGEMAYSTVRMSISVWARATGRRSVIVMRILSG